MPTQPPSAAGYWPTDGWRTAAPAEQGMDAAKLARMVDAVRQQKLGLFSLLVIRHGYIVSETYFGPYGQDTPRELYSCTKSFVGTLVGIAIDQGVHRVGRATGCRVLPRPCLREREPGEGWYDPGASAHDDLRPGLGRGGCHVHADVPEQ